MKELSTLEQLCFCTTRIEATSPNGHKYYGTGFFYMFPLEEEGKCLIYLVTNRHLAQNMKEIKFGISKEGSDGSPIFEPPVFLVYNMPDAILYHPNESIDLCAIPVTYFFKICKENGQKLFYKCIDRRNIPNSSQNESLEPIEDILFIGYPNGLWDERNNMPLVRKGITASAPYLDYNGKKEFVIDAACFPGSSGSPVFLYNNGSFRDKVNHSIVLGSRLYFLGILYGGPSSLIRSKIATGGVTSNSKSVEMTTNIPNNLGYVIKAEIMNDFIPLVETQTHSKIKKI